MYGESSRQLFAVLIRAYEKKLITEDEAVIKLQKLDSIARYSRHIIKV